ncbi:MAG: hypothetical protein IIA64_06310 [Planctomycetes bacterium]|nr:hypothetical protein [Planctomycetota bacterium]
MRTLLNILVVVMLAGILVGVVMIRSNKGIKQDQIRTARDEVRRFQRQITFQATIADVELNAEGYPVTADPNWFHGNLPQNLLIEAGHPWVEIAGRNERSLLHPLDVVVRDAAAAQFWYNPYQGIVRARVPASISDARALEVYNQVNDSRLGGLFSRSKHDGSAG